MRRASPSRDPSSDLVLVPAGACRGDMQGRVLPPPSPTSLLSRQESFPLVTKWVSFIRDKLDVA